jgi:23S rRNA (cytosine1962-C5)-methyltransferase
MESPPGHELLDAGDGRRLERFGPRIVDRPAPGALMPRRDRRAWSGAHLRFDRDSGWAGSVDPGAPWEMELDGLRLELRATPSGQVGLFPEHIGELSWLATAVRAGPDPGLPVLNLFAHTGLVTLALARVGGRVAHVDASRPAVAWARRNATSSGLGHAPVRWLVEDAERFVARELRRGARYAGVVLDPPSWGHARGARTWRLAQRLEALVEAVAALTDRRGFCLLTAHTTGLEPTLLADLLAAAFQRPPGGVELAPLRLSARSGASLDLGWRARLRATSLAG